MFEDVEYRHVGCLETCFCYLLAGGPWAGQVPALCPFPTAAAGPMELSGVLDGLVCPSAQDTAQPGVQPRYA